MPLIALPFLLACPLFAQDDVEITADVVFGHKDGLALTFDVLTPADANGAGVLAIQSGGWYSRWAPPQNLVARSRPLLHAGCTVFVVRHGSAPKYQVPEAVADVRRCVRFIRMTAGDYSVDADRLGALGGWWTRTGNRCAKLAGGVRTSLRTGITRNCSAWFASDRRLFCWHFWIRIEFVSMICNQWIR